MSCQFVLKYVKPPHSISAYLYRIPSINGDNLFSINCPTVTGDERKVQYICYEWLFDKRHCLINITA